MAFASTFRSPFFTGTPSVAASVPAPWHVALGGHPYMVSMSADATEKWGVRYEAQSVPLLRQQADNSKEPGEQSISPSQLWRRSMESWHLGAGQTRYDWPSSSPYRFRSSKNVNVWNQSELTLLPSVNPLGGGVYGAADKMYSVVAGSLYYIFAAARSDRFSSADLNSAGDPLPTSTSITGITAGWVVQSVASDGFNVWASYGTNGLLKTNTGTAAMSTYLTGSTTVVGYAKGRIIVAGADGNLWNPTPAATGAITTATNVMAPPSVGWTWTAIGEGPNCIYATGFLGDHSSVYAITINSAGTGLNAPTIAGTLPSGEIARSVYTYLGNVLVGSDKGVRLASADANNNLTFGGLIPTGSPVYDFEGQDRFVWFTWTNMDPNSTGLGRLDLQNFTGTLTPAYATDLTLDYSLFPQQAQSNKGTVRSVGTWLGKRVFTVDGSGGYPNFSCAVLESSRLSFTGTLDTGQVSYGISDPKIGVFVDVSTDPLVGAVSTGVSIDGAILSPLGQNISQGSTSFPFSASQTIGEAFSMTLTLGTGYTTYGGIPTLFGDGTVGPSIHRVTLRALPQPARIMEYTVPLMLFTRVAPTSGAPKYVDVNAERDFLDGLYRTQNFFTYQEGNRSTLVTMSDNNFIGIKFDEFGGTQQGIYVAVLREVSS